MPTYTIFFPDRKKYNGKPACCCMINCGCSSTPMSEMEASISMSATNKREAFSRVKEIFPFERIVVK